MLGIVYPCHAANSVSNSLHMQLTTQLRLDIVGQHGINPFFLAYNAKSI